MSHGGCETLVCFIPELEELDEYKSSRRPFAGGMTFHESCLKAVNQSLTIDINGSLAQNEQFFFEHGTTVSQVLQAAHYGTICGSTNGSAPQVLVPYPWCASMSPGWELGTWSDVIGPLVQFILPCIAFCYNIPRLRKFRIPASDWHLPHVWTDWSKHRVWNYTTKLVNFCLLGLTIFAALLVVSFDIIYWMVVCFAYAGPMIVSAAYEYRLDWNVLKVLPKTQDLSATSRVRLLLCTVVGNLKLGRHDPDLYRYNTEVPLSTKWARVIAIADAAKATAGQPPSVSTGFKLQTLLRAQPRLSTLPYSTAISLG